MVNLLSTKVLSDSLVSSNAAFFRVWRITRRILLLVHQSSVCLASSSIPLRIYVFNSNKHVHLAGFSAPHCLSTVALSAFYSIPEQTFAFIYYNAGLEPTTIRSIFRCSTIELIANLPRCAAPVASYLVRYKIQHTSCLSSCGLLNVTSRPCHYLCQHLL